MKRLIGLIISAVLLSPIWANAEAQGAAPKILDDMTWTGNMYFRDTFPFPIENIFSITLSIQLPSNNSAIFPVNGFINYAFVFDSNKKQMPIAGGTMIGVATNAEGGFISKYLLALQLPGGITMSCEMDGAVFSMVCKAIYISAKERDSNGNVFYYANSSLSNFTYQPSK